MKKKKLFIVLALIVSVLLLTSCKTEDNKYVKIGLLTSNEGLHNYSVGISRNIVQKDIQEGDRFGNKGEVREPDPDYTDWSFADNVTIYKYKEKGKDKKKYLVNGEQIKDLNDNVASFSMSYNEVSNYVLFHDDPAELIEALHKSKQAIDVAFFTVDALKDMYAKEDALIEAGTLKEENRTNLNGLKVVYIETYEATGAIQGFWVAKESYTKNSSYFYKVIRSLVKNNEFASLYKTSYKLDDYEAAYSNMEYVIEHSVDENDKFAYFVYNTLGKTLNSTVSADVLDYGNNVDSYTACLQYTLKSSLDKTITYTNDSYYIMNASTAYALYTTKVLNTSAGDLLLLNLYNSVFKGHTNYEYEDVMFLDEMLNQQYLMQYYKCNVDFTK